MKFLRCYLAAFIVSCLVPQVFSQNTPIVTTIGASSTMKSSNYAPQIWLDSILNKKHLYGLGPFEEMQGEITVVDGKPFYATAYKAGKGIVSQNWDIHSPFFVSANVEAWQEFELSNSISSLAQLQEQVSDLAQKQGYDLRQPFPFRIKGILDTITIHIVTPRSPIVEGYRAGVNQEKFTLIEEAGELIGFYSQIHQGVFTSKNSFIHVHFISEDLTSMGHLDKINQSPKSLKLFLPAKMSVAPNKTIVKDTEFSKGRLGNIQEIELQDLEKLHGHLCDGLVVGFQGLNEALKVLYPDGKIDRTNTRIVSKASPCLTDVAIYLTGGRYQFNTFYVSNDIDDLFIVQRIDTKKAVGVSLNKGVKPIEIDRLGDLAVKGELDGCELDELKKREDDFSEFLLKSTPSENFTVREIKDFDWHPILQNDFIKTDILNKNRPICKSN